MLRLPTAPPPLSSACRLPIAPRPAPATTLVSDSHLVPSHPESPALDMALAPHSPAPPPTTRKLPDPVPAAFRALPPLSHARSVDTATDRLPAPCPTLDATRRLPLAPDPARHRADVSDTHPVCSHPVRPDRTAPLHAPSPSPRPDTVALIDPVDAALPAPTTLAPPASPDTAAVVLPTRPPPLTKARTLPPPLVPTRHRADVSDTHAVPGAALAPIRPDAEYPASPILAPCTVTPALPVDPAFAARTPLTVPRSAEKPELKLPARPPALIAPKRLPITPDPAEHCTDESDPHAVCSQLDPPTRPDPV